VNRRSFLRNSALALFGFTVLPPAKTYQRVWRATFAAGKIEFPVHFLHDTYSTVVVGLDEQMKLYSDLLVPDKRVQEPPESRIFDEGPYKCVMARPRWTLPPPSKKLYEERPKTLAEILGVV
jgi:hypothetical protein